MALIAKKVPVPNRLRNRRIWAVYNIGSQKKEFERASVADDRFGILHFW
jgi:hypothetical protein